MEALDRSLEASQADDGVSAFVAARPRMFAAAFRRLGDAAEAEDVVQDAWLRWQNVDRDIIRNAPAFLTTTSIRLAINRVVGARSRHETPLEQWLVEPVDVEASPGLTLERGQALESAVQLLLEKLSPVERAVYVLREAFGYDYRQIARVVRISEANGRQLLARARKHLGEARRKPVSAARLRTFLEAFVAATQTGELARLEAVLRAEIARAQ